MIADRAEGLAAGFVRIVLRLIQMRLEENVHGIAEVDVVFGDVLEPLILIPLEAGGIEDIVVVVVHDGPQGSIHF